MSWLANLIGRHQVVAYVALAWGLSWAYWMPLALRGDVVTPGGSVTHFPGLAGPLVAALVVTLLASGRQGLRDYAGSLVRWRVAPRWYVVAAVPYLMFLASIALLALGGADTPPLAEWSQFSGLPALALPLVLFLVLLFNGFGEEGGWRGFLTPALLTRRGPLTTSLIVAGIWFIWHVPSFAVVETYRHLGLAIVPMMGIGLISGAIVLTWIYVGSGGSVLIVALWHLALNFGSATAAGRGLPGMLIWLGIVVWALLVIGVWMMAPVARNRPLAKRLRDGFMISSLRSPIGRFMPGMTVVGFRGRRSGRSFLTPVECVRSGTRLYVYVGGADVKQWWRNVLADPNVTVEVGGRDVPAMATVHVGRCPDAEKDLLAIVDARPRVAKLLGVTGSPRDEGALARAVERSVSVRFDLLPAG
jgi:membrane protease YdiL (CAAX protease family)